MSENSAISWTDHTFNPWIGCTKVSPACDHCYAERSTPSRTLGVVWGPGQPRHRTTPENWNLPLRWNATPFYECSSCGWRGRNAKVEVVGPEIAAASCPRCAQTGADHVLRLARPRVFCASLADVFDNEVDPAWRADLFALIQRTPSLDWLLLTKRIGNVSRLLPVDVCGGELPSNVWIGATICNQEEADRDIPKLLAVPARVRFLSIEPMLGAVDLAQAGALWSDMNGKIIDAAASGKRGIDWVIVGGESGPNARPMHPDWARSLRDQCAAAGVPFHFKQWGEWLPWTQFSDAKVDDPPEQTSFRTLEYFDGRWDDVGRPGYIEVMDGMVDDEKCVGRVGVKAAGRLLDGALHDAFPEVT